MLVTLSPVTPQEEPLFARLMQLYAYEFSDMLGLDVGEDGCFPAGVPRATAAEPWRHTLLLRVDDRPGGFAILDERSRLTGATDVADVAEFFVMRRYRRQGVGSIAAMQAFAMFPRRWEVRQIAANTAATVFWRRVIGRYTGGDFVETFIDDERWRGPVQSFDARGRTAEPQTARATK